MSSYLAKAMLTHLCGVVAFFYVRWGFHSWVCPFGKCIRMATPFLCPYPCGITKHI